jgi:hypothetical protein
MEKVKACVCVHDLSVSGHDAKHSLW